MTHSSPYRSVSGLQSCDQGALDRVNKITRNPPDNPASLERSLCGSLILPPKIHPLPSTAKTRGLAWTQVGSMRHAKYVFADRPDPHTLGAKTKELFAITQVGRSGREVMTCSLVGDDTCGE